MLEFDCLQSSYKQLNFHEVLRFERPAREQTEVKNMTSDA